MSLLFMDSFDHYATADIALGKWSSVGAGAGDSSAIAAVGRRSSNGWKFAHAAGASNFAQQLFKTLAPSDNTIIVGFAFNPVTPFAQLDANATAADTFQPTGSCPLLAVRNAGATQCWVKVHTDGTLLAYTGTTLLGTTSVPLVVNTFTFVEIKITVHNTTGAVQIRFNGVSVLNLSGINTRAGAANAWDSFRVGPPSASGATASEWDIDDLYVLDGTGSAPWNAFLGDCRCDLRVPNGAGTTTAWAPFPGAPNYGCVDEVPANGDTDYVSASTPGLTDTYNFQDAPAVGSAIFGVQHCLMMKKMDTGPCAVAPVIRHAGVDYVGADILPGLTYAYGLQIAQVNPGTAAQWTEAGFNAAEFGLKKTA